MKMQAWREKQGMSRAKLAAKLEISEMSVGRYENGRIPEPSVMRKIIKVTKGMVRPNSFYDL